MATRYRRRNRYLMDRRSSGRQNRGGDYIDYRRDMNNGRSYGNYRDNVNYDGNHQGEFHGNWMDERHYDYNDYGDMEMQYEEDLRKWAEKLKRKSPMKFELDQVIDMAKSHGVRFNEYDEMEFYAIFLAMLTDYEEILGQDPKVYIKMAKAFLEDDDIEVNPSEKVCIYLYKIVKGEE